MPSSIEDLFVHNRAWAAQMERERPGFFTSLLAQQKPKYMWIGCSDSRVPANQITGLEPGEVFVHRNVANVVVPTDLNCLSTIQYAVDQLHIEHLMVVGHYGCGGVLAALEGTRVGLADNWIRHVQDVRDRHRDLIAATAPEWRHDVLCELNAIEQVVNIAQTTVMLDAWGRGQKVTLHGWCYGLKDGLINNLHMSVGSTEGLDSLYKAAIAGVAAVKRQ
ncbi:carbonate dehydratase [Acidovorax facilis]|jgi:carbonic anhydrase|uniref:Carbonic anhydrase n=1 Tax=Acidovorax facilis TaxID=12917 RepID=A0ABV8DF87_9BURK|nr:MULTISPECIES: carbonate dehydratase [Acidovorax]ODS63929.1 MAG: carbonic anhydrase [Acidovorax sp. SCN 65-108]OGA86828.1 MAG: carbonic anhydrase [Burkholderiales bacterium GWA2_64_37]OGB07908.1 MAG: carbonic anhydrase [Burkholderiales bacterium RIFCSPHIGHO2_02_FULL_64_19]OGB19191.1 MAG: carbonic anhydrase [Burkholderiales bacterium RIFCSPHIGHO2_12_FULL_65_48]OGB57676.1 MAG: carbonic anhydrase [Burkholderiales bacterium RIFCSPLOWO2_12_FULL_64_33]OJV61776.1 MAG: carbonic anhydrase [Burkholde